MTPTQARYLAFIQKYMDQHGIPPSEMEMARVMCVMPPSVIATYSPSLSNNHVGSFVRLATPQAKENVDATRSTSNGSELHSVAADLE